MDTVEDGIRGQALVRSDVQTIPDLPLEVDLVLLPADQIGKLSEALPIELSAADPPARIGLQLTPALAEEYVVAHTRSEADGSYALAASAGDYWLCLAGIGSSERIGDDLPALINGCVAVTVPENEGLSQDIYWGEAGVTVP